MFMYQFPRMNIFIMYYKHTNKREENEVKVRNHNKKAGWYGRKYQIKKEDDGRKNNKEPKYVKSAIKVKLVGLIQWGPDSVEWTSP